MRGFLASFNPLFARYKSEVILLGCAVCIALFSVVLYLQQKEPVVSHAEQIDTTSNTRTILSKQTITVDVSGAVRKPFVYSLSSSARYIDAIHMAGGLTEEADAAFVNRNVNFARVLSDQEKIYIPSLADTSGGFVLENKRILDYTLPNVQSHQNASASLININSASVIELDQLPGIGKVNAEAIVNGRPYTTLDDLVTNSIIKQSVYDKIKDLVSVY